MNDLIRKSDIYKIMDAQDTIFDQNGGIYISREDDFIDAIEELPTFTIQEDGTCNIYVNGSAVTYFRGSDVTGIDIGFNFDFLDKNVAMKPQEAAEYQKRQGYMHCCPRCHSALGYKEKSHSILPRWLRKNVLYETCTHYCCICGQKIDWY